MNAEVNNFVTEDTACKYFNFNNYMKETLLED